jgi:hypothetical protein
LGGAYLLRVRRQICRTHNEHYGARAICEPRAYGKSECHGLERALANKFEQLTGGVGRSSLTTFYRDNFIFNNSADTDLELVSRTIGIDRVIDEFIFKFTHDGEIDWLYVLSTRYSVCIQLTPPDYRACHLPTAKHQSPSLPS